jgi:hypothetical protein
MTIHLMVNKCVQTWSLLDKKDPNQKADFSLKRNWMVLVLGPNISVENPLNDLNMILGFRVSCCKFVLFPKTNVNA